MSLLSEVVACAIVYELPSGTIDLFIKMMIPVGGMCRDRESDKLTELRACIIFVEVGNRD